MLVYVAFLYNLVAKHYILLISILMAYIIIFYIKNSIRQYYKSKLYEIVVGLFIIKLIIVIKYIIFDKKKMNIMKLIVIFIFLILFKTYLF